MAHTASAGINYGLRKSLDPRINIDLSSINMNNLPQAIPIIENELARFGWGIREEPNEDLEATLELLVQGPEDIGLIILKPPRIEFNPIYALVKQSSTPAWPVIVTLTFNYNGRAYQERLQFDQIMKYITTNIKNFTIFGCYDIYPKRRGGAKSKRRQKICKKCHLPIKNF
jgi:hypothetical protein